MLSVEKPVRGVCCTDIDICMGRSGARVDDRRWNGYGTWDDPAPVADDWQSGGVRNTERPFQRTHADEQPYRPHRGAGRRGGLSRRGRIVLIVCLSVLALILLLTGVEAAFNAGRIHRGVSVEGVDLGGLTQEQALETLQSSIDDRLAQTTVACVPNAEADARAVAAGIVATPAAANPVGTDASAASGTETAAADGASTDAAATTDVATVEPTTSGLAWSESAEAVGATFSAQEYVDEAWAVGRPDDSLGFLQKVKAFFGERWKAWTKGVAIGADLSYDDGLVSALADDVDSYVGIAMIDSTVAVTDGVAAVVPGTIGEEVDTTAFKEGLTAAFLGDADGDVVIPMESVPLGVDDAEAATFAQTMQASLDQPITVNYGSQSWTLDATTLGSWTKVTVDGKGDAAKLVAAVDTAKATAGLTELMGDLVYGTAKNASFDVSSGTPVVVPSQTGEGPDLPTAITNIQNILYGTAGANRTFTIGDASVQPELTTEEAQALGIKELIGTYTLSYGDNGGTNREHNIELALRMMNGTIVQPGDEWSWVDDMGPCDFAEGFLAAYAIGEGGAALNEAGGGICNVATGLFNAVYESGLDILERYNHSQYITHYPLGRDCTVSYPTTTFRFANDYQHAILITTSYDGTNMVISIWGTSEGRKVTSQTTDMVDRTVYNYRTVTDASGNTIHSDTFRSYFKDDAS